MNNNTESVANALDPNQPIPMGQDWLAMYNPEVPRNVDIQPIHTLHHDSVVASVAFSPDGKSVVTGCNHTIQIFDTTTGEKLSEFPVHSRSWVGDNWVRSVSFSPDGKYIATGAEDRKVRIWDVVSKQCVLSFEGHSQEVYSVDFSRDGRYVVSGSGDARIRLWDTISGKCVVFVARPPITGVPGVTAVAFSPDGYFMAGAYLDSTVRIWEVETREEVETLRGHLDSVYSVKFTHDGNYLISGSLDRTVKLWDLSSLVSFRPMQGTERCPCLKTLTGHTDYVLSVIVSHDNQWIISAAKDRTIQFWDRSTGVPHAMLKGHKNSVIVVDTCAAPSGTGGLVVTGSGDQTARLWRYTTSE